MLDILASLKMQEHAGLRLQAPSLSVHAGDRQAASDHPLPAGGACEVLEHCVPCP